MARAKTPIGTWGKITRRKLGPATWRARATMRGYDGKPRMYQMNGATGAQAEAALLAKLNEMLPPTDDVISPDMAVSELGKFWWLEFEDLGRAANTRRRYREIIDTYILPGVGNLTIREANFSALDKFHKGVRTKHGNATAKMCNTLLSGMMSLATRHGAAPANPLRDVARIPTGNKEVRALTIDEVARLRHDVYRWQQPTGRQNGLHEKDILDVVDIMLATGARIGEALAIRWSDVDLAAQKPTVTIQGTIIDVRGKNGLRIQDHPKSANSRQRYFLPLFAVDMLRRRQADPLRLNSFDLVFPSSTLTIRDPNGFRKQWQDARKAVGFDWVTPHMFRKSVGTILANTQGLAAATAQLGHSSELITSKHYVQKTHEAPDNTKVLQAFGQEQDWTTDDASLNQTGL